MIWNGLQCRLYISRDNFLTTILFSLFYKSKFVQIILMLIFSSYFIFNFTIIFFLLKFWES